MFSLMLASIFSHHIQTKLIMDVLISNKELLSKLNQLAMAYIPALEVDHDIVMVSQTYFGLSQPLLNFGEAELNYRTGERFSLLELSQDVVSYSNQQLEIWNSRGIATLDNAIQTLNEFISTSSLTTEPVAASSLDDLRLRTKEYLSQTNLKISDVQKLIDAYDEVAGQAIEGGESGVITFMRDKLIELKTVRLSPSRGTEENIPIWKLIGALILFGFVIYKALRCILRQRCCNTVSGLEGMIAFIAAVAVTLC